MTRALLGAGGGAIVGSAVALGVAENLPEGVLVKWLEGAPLAAVAIYLMLRVLAMQDAHGKVLGELRDALKALAAAIKPT